MYVFGIVCCMLCIWSGVAHVVGIVWCVWCMQGGWGSVVCVVYAKYRGACSYVG